LASRFIGTVARRAPHRSADWRRRPGCFCTRGVMQGCDIVLFTLALAKTPDKSGQAVTPGGSPRREPGRAAPPTN